MSFDNNRTACINNEISQKEKIKLILGSELMNQVNFLHNQIKKDEWSGILLYKVIEGDIENPGTLTLKADFVYPMDIGTSTYTEFDYDEAYIDMHDKLPIIEDGKRVYKIGTIHTHHGMATFFSGTDTGELHSNSPKHNYYLSLIVNFDCSYIAKVALYSPEAEYKMVFKGTTGNFEKVAKTTSGNLMIYDCEIIFEHDDWFNDRFHEVKEKKKKAIPVYSNRGFSSSKFTDEFLKKGEKKGKNTLGIDKQTRIGFESPETNLSTINALMLIGKSISGEHKEKRNLYDILKDELRDFTKKLNKHNYYTNLYGIKERVYKNFEEVCKDFEGKATIGRFKLDELATSCIDTLVGISFPKEYDDIISHVIKGIKQHVIKDTANSVHEELYY